jgi:hypothetical protein
MKKTSKLSPHLIRLLLDVDGVFFDFVEEIRQYFSKVTGRPLDTLPYANCWDFWKDQWSVTSAEFFAVYAAGVIAGDLFQAPPDPGTVECLRKIAAAGVSINIVTSRQVPGAIEEAAVATKAWINRFHVPHDTLTIVGPAKRDTALELDLNTSIDDAVHHYQELDEIGVDAYLYTRPWNKSFEGRRVASLDAFYQMITVGA